MNIVRPIKPPRTDDPKELVRFFRSLSDAQSFIQYNGNPTGVISPRWRGDFCFNATDKTWFINAGTTAADWSATSGGTLNIDDVADWSITASKLWLNIPIVQGLTITNNSPAAGSIAWTSFDIYYAGAKYSMGAGNSDKKYNYWKDLGAGIAKSDTNPASLSDWNPAEDFVIAVNISGVGQAAWSGIANQVIGNSFIESLSADKITAGTLVVGPGTSEVDSVVVSAGGDMRFEGSDSDPPLLKFCKGNVPTTYMAMGASEDENPRSISIFPDTDGQGHVYFGVREDGTTVQMIRSFVVYTCINGIVLRVYDDTSRTYYTGVEISPPSARTSYLSISDSGFFINTHKTVDLGDASAAFDNVYSDDFQNVADFFHLDDRDDLRALQSIKGSGKVDKRTGLELIDDDTLPEWMLSKHKDTGHIMRDGNGAPYLSTKMVDSLLMGACRKLDDRVKELEAKIDTLMKDEN